MASPPLSNIDQLTEEQILDEIEALQSQPFPLTEQTYRLNLLSNKNQLLTEEQVVDEITYLRKGPFPLNKQEVDRRLNLLERLHEIGKAVGYTTMVPTPKLLEELENVLQKGPFPLNEDDTDDLKLYVELQKKGKAFDYTTISGLNNSTVFHYGGNCLYTCAHVVLEHGLMVIDHLEITFEWIDVRSKDTRTHEYKPLHCDHAPPCKYSHRIGIFTNITNDEGEIDKFKTDLAIFREDQISYLQLPTIMFQSSVDMEFRTKSKVDIMPQVSDSSKSSLDRTLYVEKYKTKIYLGPEEKLWLKEKNETTGPPVEVIEDITSKPVISSNGDTLYQIYWDFDSDTPTKMFHITERIGDKSIGPCFPFNSPAPEGASGSPVMVYRKVYEDREEEFCLVGVMSGGKEYIQLAELPESIQQHSKLMMWFNILHKRLAQYRELSICFEKSDAVELKATILENQQDIKKMIIDIRRDNGVKGIFCGSLRDDEIAAN